MILADVIPITPVEGPYTYRVPDAFRADVQKGTRVLVSFGPRKITGVVLDVREGEREGAKEVLDVLDDRPALTRELLKLTHWMANYYLCTWGEALRVALPPGSEVESRKQLTALDLPEAWNDNDFGKRVLKALHERKSRRSTTTALRRELGRTLPATLLDRMEAAGVLHVEEQADARVTEKKALFLRLVEEIKPEDVVEALRGKRQKALVSLLARSGGPVPQADALKETGASSGTVKSLIKKEILVKEKRSIDRAPESMGGVAENPPPPITLNADQKAALRKILSGLESEEHKTFLLHGVTGSGKTEVYLRALRKCLEADKAALVLVPEIALTPQTVRRFRAHFGDRVAVLHSRMSDGERLDTWNAVRDGRFPVVIGPRSAVLAPVKNLGLVVVDEEHEASYKQFDPAPRYHARDVAVMRAYRAGAVCVLGSATPSLESVANVRTGKYTRLELPERVPVQGTVASLPDVRVVDLAREWGVRRLKGALSETLREAIRERLDREEQMILLQNRRGFAPVLQCEACGWTPTCPNCSVSLTYHHPRPGFRRLRCHYCGHAQRILQRCASEECGDGFLRPVGSGTQRVEEELAEVFPDARALRMDRDTTSRKGAHARILDRFGAGQADILLGTQMVAKGLDFPKVTLVGVVNADTGLLLPDFRAGERTFQLLAQVAGRAGRRELPGEVILQTRHPMNPAIQFAVVHDSGGFIEEEMTRRKETGFPPYARMIGIEIKGPEEEDTHRFATEWTERLRKEASTVENVRVLGPVAASVGRVQKQWRMHTHLLAPRSLPASVLGRIARKVQGDIRTPRGFRVNMDVDPVGMF